MLAVYHGYSSPSPIGSSLLYLIPIITILILVFWGIIFAFIMRFVRK